MNNPKILKKVLVVALTLAMVVGAFSMFTFGSSADEVVYNEISTFYAHSAIEALLSESGVTFDDFAGWSQSNSTRGTKDGTYGFLRDEAGFYFSEQKSDVAHGGETTGAYMTKEADGNAAINLKGNTFWINGNVGNAKNDTKYNKSAAILDLLTNPNAPSSFTLSMDLKVNGTSGEVSGFARTSDNNANAGAYLGTYYRGSSGVTLFGTWVFKITSANIPKYTVAYKADVGNSKNVTFVDIADSVEPNMIDKGYIYPNSNTVALGSTGSDELAAYSALHGSKTDWATYGSTGACISEKMMANVDDGKLGSAVSYKLNEYFTVSFDITKTSSTKINVKTYITTSYYDKTQVSEHNITIGGDNDWSYGLRFFDIACDVNIDNVKVVLNNESFDVHTGPWKQIKREMIATADGFSVRESCAKCGEVFSVNDSAVAYTGIGSQGVGVKGNGEGNSVPANGTTPETVGKLHFENISSEWATLKAAPFWINFDLLDITSLTTVNTGKSLVTWLFKSTGYIQFFRLFANGEIRLKRTDGAFTVQDSDFRLKGTAENPGNYRFNIYVDPATGRYDVYVDNLDDAEGVIYYGSEYNYAMSALQAMDSGYPQVRFNDSGTATFRVANFNITTNGTHNHSYVNKSVVVEKNAIYPAGTCFCGAEKIEDAFDNMLVETNNVYYGSAEIENIPTEGTFWISTNYNIRNAEALEAVKALGADVALGDFYAVVDRETIKAPATYQLALRVEYAEGADVADVEFYVDGTLIGTTKDVALGDVLTLGGIETTDVRFGYTKVVGLGDANVTFKDATDNSLIPCFHTPANVKFVKETTGDYSATFTCDKCGEVVGDATATDYHDDAKSGVNFVDGKIEIYNNSNISFYKFAELFPDYATKPYQINFTLTLPEAQTITANEGGKGWNIFNFDGKYNSILRQYPGENGTIKVTTYLGDGVHELLDVFAAGDSREISLLVDPVNETVEIYIDGEYKYTRNTDGYSNTKLNARLGDSAAKFVYSDFSLLALDETHVHSDAWTATEDKSVFVTDKVLEYRYVCYCGETVGVSDITKVHSAFNVLYRGMVTSYSDDIWYAFDLNVRAEGALENVPYIISSGELKVPTGELKAPGTYQYAVNLKANADGTYNAYVYSGENMACVEYKNVTLDDSIIFVEGMGENARIYNFRMLEIGETDTPVELVYQDGTDASIKPCYHSNTYKFVPVAGETYVAKIKTINKLVKVGTCTKCGEVSYASQGEVLDIVPNYKDTNAMQLDSTGSMVDVARGARYIGLNRNDVMLGADPFWISFDISAEMSEGQVQNVINKGTNGASILAIKYPQIDDGTTNSGTWGAAAAAGKDTYNYIQLMRAFGLKDGDGNDIKNAIGINFYHGGADNPKFIMESGKSYNVAIYIEPKADGIHYYAYLNGVLVETRHETGSTVRTHFDPNRIDASILDEKNGYEERMFTFRFTDGNYGDMHLANVSLVKAVADPEHVHSDAWATEKSIKLTDRVLEYYYTCYCEKPVMAGQIDSIITDGIKNVYENTTFGMDAATTAPYWVAFDYNIRTAEVPTEAKVIVNGNEIDLTAIVETEGLNTYGVAVAVVSNTVYEVYVDNALVLVGEGENLLAEDATIEFSTGENVRFNTIKHVTIGETDEPKVPTYAIDDTVRPCFHVSEVEGFLKDVTRNEDGTLGYSFVCAKCGEKVINMPVVDAHNDSTCGISGGRMEYANGAFKNYKLPADFVGGDKEPYQFEFTLTLNKVYSKPENLYNSGQGRNIANFDGNYNAVMRQMPVSDGNGGYLTDRIDIVSGNVAGKQMYLTTMYEGDSIVVSWVVDPSKPTIDIYIDGVYIGTRDGSAMDKTDTQIRFGDSEVCSFVVSDFKLMRAGETSHTHSHLWLNDEEKAASSLIITEDKHIAYTYTCYCGETVVAGVANAIAENVAPLYNATEAAVVLADVSFENRPVLAGSLMAKELPAEGIKSLVAIDDIAIISVDSEGKLYVNEEATEVVLGDSYTDYAIVAINGGVYNVYFDGACVATVSLGEIENASIILGSEGMGVFHFDNIVLAELEADYSAAFVAGTDGHNHAFDPYTAELIFNEDKTTITVEYVCTICDRPAVDGIVEDLYDDDNTDEVEAIPANLATAIGGSVIVENVENYVSGLAAYWFSADYKVIADSNMNREAVVSLGGKNIVTIDVDGTIRLAAAGEPVIGSADGYFNVTIGVVPGAESATVHVYIDGVYSGTVEVVLGETNDIVVGANASLVMEVINIKLAEIGNNGQRAIGSFVCDYHTYNFANAKINYLDLGTFVVTNKCVVCGHAITERPIYNYYADAIVPVFNFGGITATEDGAQAEGIYSGSYWIVADVNLRSNSIGKFTDYKNLIGEGNNSYVLVNSQGRVILGDGTPIGTYFDSTSAKSTRNIAVRVDYSHFDEENPDAIVIVYIDGAYVGEFLYSNIKYTNEYEIASLEVFGAPELENVKFYNIKSFEIGVTDAPVGFAYAEDETVVPCAHIFNDSRMTKTAVFGEKIQIIYTCENCGERVHKVFDKNLYDASLNSTFKFDETGTVTISTTTTLNSTSAILGSSGSKYWLKFKLNVETVNEELVGANNNNNNGGRNFLNFNTNYNSPLRLFAIKDTKNGGYVDNCLAIRSNSAVASNFVGTIYEGQSYDIALYVNPASQFVEIYFDGKLVATRTKATYATGTQIRFLDGNWGTFHISDFEFVSCPDLEHEHTAKYSQLLGVADTLKFGEQTLEHTYLCNCGATVVEGISKIYGDEIKDREGITTATVISEAANVAVNGEAYWVSAKVYSNGADSTVYSYVGEDIVAIEGGVYTIGGVATTVAVSGTSSAKEFDLISIRIDPVTDVANVYINGYHAGTCNTIDFAENEKFNIKLGGGAALDFKFVKAVSLEEGAANKVNIYGCGDHAFGYRYGITAEVTSTGVAFKCRYCSGTKYTIRTATLGSGAQFTKDGPITSSSNDEKVDLTSYRDTIFSKDLADSFFISIDFNASSFTSTGSRTSFITWTPATAANFGSGRAYNHLVSVKKVGDDYKLVLNNSKSANSVVEVETNAVVKLNTDHNIILEINPSTLEYYVYLDGTYIGSGAVVIDNGASYYYALRINNGTGTITYKNIKVFNPEKDETKAPTAVAAPSIPAIHRHYPDVKKSQTMSVVDGKIVYTFTCADSACKSLGQVTLNHQEDALVGFANKYEAAKQTSIKINGDIGKGSGTYIMSFDVTIRSVNHALIGNSSRSFLSIESSKLGNSGQIRFLRIRNVPDGNGGYVSGAVRFAGHDSDILGGKTFYVGDTVNFKFVVNPDSGKIATFINNEYVAERTGLNKPTANDGMTFRLLQNVDNKSIGIFNFTNFEIVRMGYVCEHEAPECTGTALRGQCALCGVTVDVAHKYEAVVDMTGYWTKYTCTTCNHSYMVFNHKDTIAALTFENSSELLKYLSEKYYPVFR